MPVHARCGGCDWFLSYGFARICAEGFALHHVRCGGCDWFLATDDADLRGMLRAGSCAMLYLTHMLIIRLSRMIEECKRGRGMRGTG